MKGRNLTFCIHETLNADDTEWVRFYVVYEIDSYGTRRISKHPIETPIAELQRMYPGIWGRGVSTQAA